MIASLDFISAVEYMIHFIYHFISLNFNACPMADNGARVDVTLN